jgi:Flp pilus assembly pilin Flp
MPKKLAGDERGALLIEYLVVTAVGLMIATALVGLGIAMVNAFGPSLQILYSEYP